MYVKDLEEFVKLLKKFINIKDIIENVETIEQKNTEYIDDHQMLNYVRIIEIIDMLQSDLPPFPFTIVD